MHTDIVFRDDVSLRDIYICVRNVFLHVQERKPLWLRNVYERESLCSGTCISVFINLYLRIQEYKFLCVYICV